MGRVNLDIDDAMRAEETLTAVRERLALASQVATGAQLSAPIAHKMVQPLSALVANARAALHWLEGRSQRHPPRRISYRDRPARWHVDRECRARDARALQGQSLNREIVQPNDLIRQVVLVVERDLLWKGIELSVDFGPTSSGGRSRCYSDPASSVQPASKYECVIHISVRSA